MAQQTRQEFNDGVIAVYSVSNVADPGNKPREQLTLKERLRFKRRTVGAARYYAAMQANKQIEQAVRCPLRECVSPLDVAVIMGRQYRIEQVQYPEDIVPPVMDLSLSRLERNYELGEN